VSESPLAAIQGRCDPRFERLREAFAANFEVHGELGAALAVVVEGELLVDLWAGWSDAARTRRWASDTLVNVYSAGKPMPVICLLALLERGELALEAPVARYWPEFAAAGKEEVTVRMLLSHRAGLPAIRRELPEFAMYDWELMTSELAAEEPWWEPDSGHGYHVNTYGFLVGELVRRLAGASVGACFDEIVARPLDVDLYFGLPASEEGRVAEFVFAGADAAAATEEFSSASTPTMVARAYVNPPGLSGFGLINSPAWRRAEMPSSNGHGTARALARIYGELALGGGQVLLRPETIALASREFATGRDLVLARPSRFGLGFQLTQPERPLGPSGRSFGHFGAGGAVGFADPDRGIGFAYVSNQLKGPRWQNPRNRGVIDALYSSA
jgi:CubicO group peptidase (beta-lactamase class C family)